MVIHSHTVINILSVLDVIIDYHSVLILLAMLDDSLTWKVFHPGMSRVHPPMGRNCMTVSSNVIVITIQIRSDAVTMMDTNPGWDLRGR